MMAELFFFFSCKSWYLKQSVAALKLHQDCVQVQQESFPVVGSLRKTPYPGVQPRTPQLQRARVGGGLRGDCSGGLRWGGDCTEMAGA